MRKHCTICGKFVRETDCCKPAEILSVQHPVVSKEFWKGVRNGFLITVIGAVVVYCIVRFVF